MAKREWMRIGICGIIGLILGIILAINYKDIRFSFILPFYGIGIFYGMRLILVMLGGIGKTAGQSLFHSIARGNWIGLLIIIILLFIASGLVLTLGWIIGLFVAGKALFDAYLTDSDIAPSDDGNTGGWDDEKTVKNKNNKKKNEFERYDSSDW